MRMKNNMLHACVAPWPSSLAGQENDHPDKHDQSQKRQLNDVANIDIAVAKKRIRFAKNQFQRLKRIRFAGCRTAIPNNRCGM